MCKGGLSCSQYGQEAASHSESSIGYCSTPVTSDFRVAFKSLSCSMGAPDRKHNTCSCSLEAPKNVMSSQDEQSCQLSIFLILYEATSRS